MGTRLQGTFYSFGRRPGSGSSSRSAWVVSIDDDDYSGSPIDFKALDLKFSWSQSDDTIFSPIVTSSCDIVILVDTDDLDDFVTDQIDFIEGRFKVKITRDGFLYWCGYVLPDLVRAQMAPLNQGYAFSVKATDGLARLKTVDFSDDGDPYTGEATVFDLFFLALEKVGLTSYWSSAGSQVYVYIQSTWWASQHASKASTANFMPNTRINHRVWRKVDTRDGAILYRSVWQVLEQLCLAFGLRLMFSNGTYWITEIAQYGNFSGTIRYQAYAVDKATRVPLSGAAWAGFKRTTGSVVQWNDSSRQLMVYATSEEAFYAPLQKSIVVYKHYSTSNLISGENWSSANLSSLLLEDVDHNGGASRISMAFTLTCKLADSTVIDFTAIPPTWFQFNVLISINDGTTTYYLKRTANFSAGQVVYGTLEWTTSSADRYQIWVGPQIVDNAALTNQVNVITPPMPVGGDVTIQVLYNAAARLEGVLSPSGTRTITYATSNAYLEVFADGNVEDQYNYLRYEVVNSDTNNSEKQEVDLLLGSGPTLNAYGAVRVYNGSAWVKPTGWGKLSVGVYTQDMGQLLAQERMGMQDRPVKRWSGSMQGDYVANFLMVRSHDDAAYIVQQVNYDAAIEVWQGTWVQVGYNSTKVILNPTQQFITNPVGISGGDPDEPPGLSSILPGLRALHGTLFADRYDGGVNRQTSAQSGLNAVTARNVPLVLNTAISAGATLTSMSVKASPYAVDSGYYGSIWPGDRIDLVHPITGEYQTFHVTVRAGWSTGTAFTLTISSATAAYSFPQGAYVFLNGAFEFQYGTRNWNIRSYQIVLFGRTSPVTTGHSEQFIAVNNHTFFAFFQINFVTPGTDKINITIYVNGVALPGYPSNLDTTSNFVESAPNYTLAQGDIISIGVNSVSGTAPIGMSFTVILTGNDGFK